jgi:hypothetical protein
LKICRDAGYTPENRIEESIIRQNYAVVGSKSDKVLYVNNPFTTEDVWQMVREDFKLKSDDATLIYKEYVKLLK